MMRRRKLIEIGTPDVLLTRPADPYLRRSRCRSGSAIGTDRDKIAGTPSGPVQLISETRTRSDTGYYEQK